MLDNINEMTTEEISKKLTEIMDSAYSKFDDDNGYIRRWYNENITNQEKVMMILGNFNYQVCNGGTAQWIDNGYAGCEDMYKDLFPFQRKDHLNNLLPVFRVLGALVDKYSEYNIELATNIYNICRLISDLPSEYCENGEDIEVDYFEEEDEDGNIIEHEEEYEVEVDPEPLHILFEPYDNKYYEFKEEDVFRFFAHIIKGEENSNILSDEYIEYDFNKISLERDMTEEDIQKIAEKTGVKYPQVKVDLVGQDGNAFSILGRVEREMKRAKISKEEIAEFMEEAKSGNYDHLLITVMKYVNSDNAINLDEEFKKIIEEEKQQLTHKI